MMIFSFFACMDVKNEKNVIFWGVTAHFSSKIIEKSWFLNFCGCEKCKKRNFRLVFMQNLFFGILSQLIFVEKQMKNHDFWILRIQKNTKPLIFPWFFAENGNFDESASWWSEKKNFRDGSGGTKMSFNTLLRYTAIKIWHRLIKFLHFWWFDFLIF